MVPHLSILSDFSSVYLFYIYKYGSLLCKEMAKTTIKLRISWNKNALFITHIFK
jgi:hypothetical protein